MSWQFQGSKIKLPNDFQLLKCLIKGIKLVFELGTRYDNRKFFFKGYKNKIKNFLIKIKQESYEPPNWQDS
jgi:hypothetical protein